MKKFIFIVSMILLSASICCSEDQTRGEQIYHAYCLKCHGVDGKGISNPMPGDPPGPKDFSTKGYLSSFDEESLFQVVLNGKEGTDMMGFSGNIPVRDIDAVINHISQFEME